MFGSAHKVYVGYGNPTHIDTYKDISAGEPLDMSGATKVKLCIGGTDYESTQHTDEISWHSENTGEPDEVWVIDARIGLLPSVPLGQQEMAVVVYDIDNPEGLVIEEALPIEVVGVC